MNPIADNAPQPSKNVSSARLTCVMCGGDNALDATQCEHCGAALKPSILAASPGAASTRAATETAAPRQPAPEAAPQKSAVVQFAGVWSGSAPSPPFSATSPQNESPNSRAVATAPVATSRDAAPRATSPEAAAPVTFSFAPTDVTDEAVKMPPAATTRVSSSPEISGAAQVRADAAAPISDAAARQNPASTRDAPVTRGAVATEEVRAQALLDRAFALSESGDLDAAILACSEAALLQPGSAAPPSMLALLLERAGDSAGAIKAYRRALKIAPENRAARDSLARLQATTENLATLHAAAQTPAVTSFLTPPAELAREYSPGAAAAHRTTAPHATAGKDAPAAPATTSVVAAPAGASSKISSAAMAPEVRATNAETAVAAPLSMRASNAAAAPPTHVANAAANSFPANANAAPRAACTRGADDLGRATQDDIFAMGNGVLAPSAAEEEAFYAELAARPQPASRKTETRRGSYFLRSLPLAAAALCGSLLLSWSSGRAPQKNASTRVTKIAPTPTSPPVAVATQVAPQNQSVQEQLAAAVAAAQAAPKNIAPTATPLSNAAPVPTATPFVTPTASATPFAPTPATSNAVSPNAANNGAVPILPPQTATPAGDSSNFERASQLQQRSLASLEAGDNIAAARGFGSAIETYNAQIATGFRVDEARSAIAACRDGIQLAQQMQNRAASPR